MKNRIIVYLSIAVVILAAFIVLNKPEPVVIDNPVYIHVKGKVPQETGWSFREGDKLTFPLAGEIIASFYGRGKLLGQDTQDILGEATIEGKEKEIAFKGTITSRVSFQVNLDDPGDKNNCVGIYVSPKGVDGFYEHEWKVKFLPIQVNVRFDTDKNKWITAGLLYRF